MTPEGIEALKVSLDRKSVNLIIVDSSRDMRGLREEYKDQHAVFTKPLWRYTAQAGETLEGYWPWVLESIAALKSSFTPADFSKALGLPVDV